MTDAMEVRFEPSGRSVRVAVGTTLLDAARMAGEPIDASCDGNGLCGECRVRATGPLSAVTRDEHDLVGRTNAEQGTRLACRVRGLGDVVVWHEAPGETMRVEYEASAADDWRVSAAAVRDGEPLGAAVDLGTTTVALTIVDLATGVEVARAGALNVQSAFGADVMSRVARAMSGGADELRAAIVGQVEQLLQQALARASAAAHRLEDIVIVGNTAMLGLFLGRDLSPLAEAPYEGAPVAAGEWTAAELGMTAFANARVRALPGVSAFVGADIVAGLLATGIADRPGPTLLVDVGTNGEIVLVTGDAILATSAAAGPALEGAALSAGMRAEDGAIERVTLAEGALTADVIGNGAPRGICGSGAIDLLRVLLDEGVIDATGAFAVDSPSPLAPRMADQGVRAFMLDPHVWFTQLDVRQAQFAIAAVRTGIDTLLAEAGIAPADVAETVLAGGFGTRLDSESVIRVGLLPAPLAGDLTFAGNTALAGAKMALTAPGALDEASALAARIRTIDLAAQPDFQDRYLATLAGVFGQASG